MSFHCKNSESIDVLTVQGEDILYGRLVHHPITLNTLFINDMKNDVIFADDVKGLWVIAIFVYTNEKL